MKYKHNNFWRHVVMIAMVIVMIHGIGRSALAAELSETISGLTSSGYDYNFSKSGTHFTVSGVASLTGVDIGGENARVTARSGETITRIEFTINNAPGGLGNITASPSGTVTISNLTVSISNINANTVNFQSSISGHVVVFTSITIYYKLPETYTITIPSELTVSNTGWNALDGGISVDSTLASGKTLIVTASSDTGFNFVKSDDSNETVAYYFVESSDSINEFNSSDAQVSWEFESSGSKDIGIVIEDYSTKPAGTYTETVTFTASVESSILAPIFKDGSTTSLTFGFFDGTLGCTFNKSNGTYTVTNTTKDTTNDNVLNNFAFKSIAQNGDKLVITFGLLTVGNSGILTLDKSDDSYYWGGNASSYWETSIISSLVVNDVDITSQLTKK